MHTNTEDEEVSPDSGSALMAFLTDTRFLTGFCEIIKMFGYDAGRCLTVGNLLNGSVVIPKV